MMQCYPFRVSWCKFCTCTIVSVNGTLVEDKMCTFKGESAHFSFNKCPIYTHKCTILSLIETKRITVWLLCVQGEV
jgi:hypothetical protein